MFSARAYIQQVVGNPFFSEFLFLHSVPGGLGQTINQTFENENVKLCLITIFFIDPLINPTPPFIIFSNVNIPFVQLTGAGNGGSAAGNFYYITRGDILRLDSNNANVGFGIFFQKIYSSADKVYKER